MLDFFAQAIGQVAQRLDPPFSELAVAAVLSRILARLWAWARLALQVPVSCRLARAGAARFATSAVLFVKTPEILPSYGIYSYGLYSYCLLVETPELRLLRS